MTDRTIDRNELIAGINDSLCFDSGLSWAAQKALSRASDDELVDLLAATASIRQRLARQESILRKKNCELFNEIETWNRENQYYDTKSLRELSLELQAEEGPIFRLVEILRNEHADLRRRALNGEVRPGIYFSTAGAISAAASKTIKKRADLDEKIDLAELAAESLVGINTVAIRRGSKPLNDIAYNCFQAFIQVDALGGFDRNIDRFSSVVADDLRRIGPRLFDYVRSAEFEERRHQAIDGDSIDAMDLLLNCADTLSVWGVFADEQIRDDVFAECFKLYEQALALVSRHKKRAPLVIGRYSDAYLRVSRLKFETVGIAGREEIFANCMAGIQLLSRISSASGDLSSDEFDTLPSKLRELQFAVLIMEVDPRIEGLKSYAVSTIFELADRYGRRLSTLKPWAFLVKIFSEIYDDVETGISILTNFMEEAHSDFARFRASATLAHLNGDRYITAELTDDPSWLEGLRDHPASVFAFKRALLEYYNRGFGPKGTQPPLVVDSAFSDVGYVKLFMHLLAYDKLLQERPSDQFDCRSILRESGLLSHFQELFGKEQAAGLEELSKFLLYRGKSRLFDGDVLICAELLKIGISNSDDAFWYGRLVDSYRHVKAIALAEEAAFSAQAKFPNDSQIAVQTALVQVAKGNFAGAAAVISRFVAELGSELSSQHAAVQGVYAYSMMRSDHEQIAEGIYRGMVTARPGDWRASHELGCLLYRRGRPGYLEALRLWTSTILIRDKVDDVFEDWIARDCVLNIAQTVKELNLLGFEGKGDLLIYLNGIGEKLPTAKLVGIMNAMMICGGLQDQVLYLAEHVSGRRDDRLSKAFSQCCMSMLIEDVIKQRDTSYATKVIEFALEFQTLGDLFGGAKGSYIRNLLRISAMPIVEQRFSAGWNKIKDMQLSTEWSTVAKLVSQSGYTANYYSNVYAAIEFAKHKDGADIEEMLYQTIYRVADALKSEVDRRKILLDESFTRSFSVSVEDAISNDLCRTIYNCDPDKLRALLQHFEHLDVQNSEEATTWELGGEIDAELEHSLMTANIRTELIRGGAFIASVGSGPAMFN